MVPQVHGHHLGRPRGDRHPWRRRLWQGGDGQGNCSNNIQNVQNVKDFNEVHHCCFAVSQPAKHCICSKVFEKAGNTFIV